jgi:hypothetical protein
VVHKEEECDSRVGRHYMYVTKLFQRRVGGGTGRLVIVACCSVVVSRQKKLSRDKFFCLETSICPNRQVLVSSVIFT